MGTKIMQIVRNSMGLSSFLQFTFCIKNAYNIYFLINLFSFHIFIYSFVVIITWLYVII